MVLSLSEGHSFPLDEVLSYLDAATVREVLTQALLDAPLFKTRWRWNATISLAVPRRTGAHKLRPQLQRILADDFLAAVLRLEHSQPAHAPGLCPCGQRVSSLVRG